MKPVLYRYKDTESVVRAMDGYTPGEGWTPLFEAPATAPEQMPLERDCICHQSLHLDAYSGGAAPEGLHGALWVVVEGVRKKYVLADQSSEPKDMPALATTPKQPRPFVPWSKEAEMLESWAAQRVPDADDILRVVCETDPADFNDKRNICISPEDLGDILRDALPSPTPTASKLHVWQAAEIERLKTESEERLQNCAALVAEVERLRKDAERYQWLAEYLVSDDESYDDAIVAATTVKEVDSVIDNAMKGTS